jgi:hypothetical protein
MPPLIRFMVRDKNNKKKRPNSIEIIDSLQTIAPAGAELGLRLRLTKKDSILGSS